MPDLSCARGCRIRGEHWAACDSYGLDDGECTGCVPSDARDDALVCSRCYGRLHRALERAPELVEYLRMIRVGSGSRRFDPQPRQRKDPSAHAPVSPDVLDATIDVMEAIGAQGLTADTTPGAARELARTAVNGILANFGQIVNDADALAQWWQLVMAHEIPTHPDFWTITRALSRWPLEDRRRWARMPCPGCDMLLIAVVPPTRAGAPTWYSCTHCDWERSDLDDGESWTSYFGAYNTTMRAVDE